MISLDDANPNMPQNPKPLHSHNDEPLAQFRQELYNSFNHRPNAIMNLLDALASNTAANSVAQLSLNPRFSYQYPSIYDGIDSFFTASDPYQATTQRQQKEMELMGLILPYLSPPQSSDFWLFCLDVTPAPRPFANTLVDRTCVYQPNTIESNKPIAYGHQYAVLVHLPEKVSIDAPPWVVPLSMRRVPSDEKATAVQAQQMTTLLSQPTFTEKLCVTVVDT